jgi:hypothetical protein
MNIKISNERLSDFSDNCANILLAFILVARFLVCNVVYIPIALGRLYHRRRYQKDPSTMEAIHALIETLGTIE